MRCTEFLASNQVWARDWKIRTPGPGCGIAELGMKKYGIDT